MKRPFCSRCICDVLFLIVILPSLRRIFTMLPAAPDGTFLIFFLGFAASAATFCHHLLLYSLLLGRAKVWKIFNLNEKKANLADFREAFLIYLEKETIDAAFLKKLLLFCMTADGILFLTFLVSIYGYGYYNG